MINRRRNQTYATAYNGVDSVSVLTTPFSGDSDYVILFRLGDVHLLPLNTPVVILGSPASGYSIAVERTLSNLVLHLATPQGTFNGDIGAIDTSVKGVAVYSGRAYFFNGYEYQEVADAQITNVFVFSEIGRHEGVYYEFKLIVMILEEWGKFWEGNNFHYVTRKNGLIEDKYLETLSNTNTSVVRVFSSVKPIKNYIKDITSERNELESDYLSEHPDGPNLIYDKDNWPSGDFGEYFAFTYANWTSFLTIMHEITGNNVYLDHCRKVIDSMLHFTDQNRFDRGEIILRNITLPNGEQDYQYSHAPKEYVFNSNGERIFTPVPGWRRTIPFGEGTQEQVLVLIDGLITSKIALYCDYVLSRSELDSYHEEAIQYLHQCQPIIDSHETTYSETKLGNGVNNYFYPSHNNALGDAGLQQYVIAHNQALAGVAILAMCAKHLPEQEHRIDRINKILNFFRDTTATLDNGGLVWAYGQSTAVEPVFLRDSFRQSPKQNMAEDINHAGIDLLMFYLINKAGFISDSELEKIVLGVSTSCEIKGTGIMSYRFTGQIHNTWDRDESILRSGELSRYPLYLHGFAKQFGSSLHRTKTVATRPGVDSIYIDRALDLSLKSGLL